MKNAFVSGLVVGVFSGTWLFVMHTLVTAIQVIMFTLLSIYLF